MSVPFILEHGIYGPRATVTGAWTSEIARQMHREGVRELYLNHARGWKGATLEFLHELPALAAFSLVDFTIRDITPIHELTGLHALEISTYCDTPIDFQRFPNLERCLLYWRRGSQSLFQCAGLKWLFIHRYNEASSMPFARLLDLEELSIANSELREIEHLSALSTLRFLGLFNLKHIASLRGIESLVQLDSLEINGCKAIGDIEELRALTHLRRLQLNDNGMIASLTPLDKAVNLEEVLFFESTNIADGDLTPLARLPRLSKIAFQNRRHYSHKREELLFVDHSSRNSAGSYG
jgi:Leucine-rich repeat (LRR) protein